MEVVQINTPIAVMFVVYALLMLYIGFYFYKQNKNFRGLFSRWAYYGACDICT